MFSSFLKFFQVSTLQGALGTFFRENCLKTSSKLVWRLSSLFLDTFENSIFFRVFLPSFTKFDLQVALGKKYSEKIPHASLDTFGNVFRDLEILESFRFLWIFLSLQGSLGRAFFRRNNQAKHAQTMFLGTFLEKFESFAVFPLFCIFSKFRPPRVHWARKNRKNYLEQVWTFFETFFGILKLWNFRFVWIFLESPGFTGHSVFRRKNQSKHSQAMFLGKFSDIFENFKVFLFFKVFSKPRPSRLHWRLFFEEKLPQNRFGQCLDNIRDSFGHFRNIEIFHFFQSFPYSTLQGALGTNFTETLTSKQVQNMFDCFWERFLGILKNWKIFQFFGVFPSFDSPGCTGHVFPKKSPQNNFKTCLDTFRNVFGHFWNFKFFSIFFSKFSKFRPSRVHWSNFFTGKTTSKHNQNLFELFGEHFWAFWKINESFSIFLMFFHVSTLQSALGKIFFRKIPQNKFKTCLETFKNVFGHF